MTIDKQPILQAELETKNKIIDRIIENRVAESLLAIE